MAISRNIDNETEMDTQLEKLKQSASYFPVGLTRTQATPSTSPTPPPSLSAKIIANDVRKFNRCQCDNCVKEKLGLIEMKPGEKRVHICPFPGCAKLYGKTSHLKVTKMHTHGAKMVQIDYLGAHKMARWGSTLRLLLAPMWQVVYAIR